MVGSEHLCCSFGGWILDVRYSNKIWKNITHGMSWTVGCLFLSKKRNEVNGGQPSGKKTPHCNANLHKRLILRVTVQSDSQSEKRSKWSHAYLRSFCNHCNDCTMCNMYGCYYITFFAEFVMFYVYYSLLHPIISHLDTTPICICWWLDRAQLPSNMVGEGFVAGGCLSTVHNLWGGHTWKLTIQKYLTDTIHA